MVFFTGGGLRDETLVLTKTFLLIVASEGAVFNSAPKAPMHTGRASHGIVRYRGDVYVLGGLNKFSISTNSFERYNIA
jgi:hypothetical protein